MAQHVLKQIIVNEFKCITIAIITILIIITASKWNELKKTWIIWGNK